MERSKRTFFKQHISKYQKFSYVDTNVLLYLFRIHAMSFYDIETWFIKLHKKDLNNISVLYHKVIKRICGRNSYYSKHECLEYTRLPIFKHLLAWKFVCYAHRLFMSKNPSPLIHKHYLKYNSVFRNSLERFFSENYRVTNVFDNPLCSIISRLYFVQRTDHDQ